MRRTILVGISVLIIIFLLLGTQYSDYRKKNLSETLTVQPHTVTEISLGFGGKYRNTTDKQKIEEFFQYFDSVNYQRLRGDQTAYMPMTATIIYLFEDDHSNFIVPYNYEAMINYKVYKVKNGEITSRFLHDYYQSLDE